MVYPPPLMDPIWLAAAVVVVFWWAYCVQHADRHITLSTVPKPYLNVAVLVGGPLVWTVLMVTQKVLSPKAGKPAWMEMVAAWLGFRPTAMDMDGEGISVTLCRSDGKPMGGRLRGPVKQAEAMVLARRIVHRSLILRASDILLDPKAEDQYQLRYRVDGLLRKPEWLDPELSLAVVNCFKILADMDIADRRRPQDGALLARQDEREFKLRVATSGTLYGEKVAIRVLNSQADLLPLEKLGMAEEYMHRLRRFLGRSHGMMVVCGPTGSGKTTTLYATLGALAQGGRNIITIEDPVEYALPFASQTAINPKAGITFAGQLRHVLRQAPDVIMIGEIRDAETARIALQSSETGHLVFSTLHANDAISGLIRLVDLGIEPFLVGAGLGCVLSQRLVRVLCKSCRRRAEIPYRLRQEAEKRDLHLGEVYEPGGCFECGETGYLGRLGIFQMLDITSEIGDMLVSRPSATALNALAKERGMTTMRQDGVAKVLAGITSVDEVLRVTVE